MKSDPKELDKLIEESSSYDQDYLYFLLGSVTGRKFQPQSDKEAQDVGKGFFEKFKEQFRVTICSKGGPYEQFVKGMVTKKDLPKFIAIAILGGASALGGVLITNLIAVYLALLVVQTGLATYCDGFDKNGH